MDNIPESDWKLLRELAPVALGRFCDRILSETVRIASDGSTTSHERYRLVFGLIKDRDRDIAAAFDGLRRSTAQMQLVRMRSLGAVADKEFARFSAETQSRVNALAELGRQ